MAKEWAKAFYNSGAWKRVRAYVIARDHGLCHECGHPGYIVHHVKELTPSNIHNRKISLSPANLEYLCKDCHDKIHGVGASTATLPYRITSTGEIVPMESPPRRLKK